MRLKFIPLLVLSLTLATISFAQKKEKSEKSPLESLNISGLKWRNVGPALTSGRISDIAVHPEDPYIYYVATSSGGVWKTTNAGNTYKPIFDSQGSYSIGCVTIDPNNPNVIWVGLVGFPPGDGLLRCERWIASIHILGDRRSCVATVGHA